MMFSVCSAQNLISNPGFEDTSSCPTQVSQITNAIGWSRWSITPDLMHVCSTSPGSGPDEVGVPANFFGYQYPRSGNAYAGIHTFASNGFNTREALGTQLIQPLTIGQKYFIKFFVSRAHSLNNGGINGLVAGSDKLGARFTTFPYSYTNPIPIDNFAHFYTDSIIGDTTNWVLISGSFIADSAYTYVGFGNFFDDNNTSTIVYSNNNPFFAYYYIDDISVSTDSLYITGIPPIDPDYGVRIYPNPFYENLNISIPDPGISEILLYEIRGRMVLQNKFTGSITLATGHLSSGVYLYEIRNKNGPDSYRVIRKGMVVKE